MSLRAAQVFLAAMLAGAPAAAAQGVPEVTGVVGGEVELRYPVAHLHEKSVCFGYLYFTREAVRYVALNPSSDRLHSVIRQRSEIVQVQKRPYFTLRLAAAEFSLRGRPSLSFTPVSAAAIDGSRRLEDSQLPVELLLEAANNFQELQSRLLARARARPPVAEPPKPSPAPPSAAPPRPAPPPAARPASLIVSARPGGSQVYVNDEFRGATSASEGRLVVSALEPGSFRVRLSASGHQDWTQTVTLTSGQTLTLEAVLKPAGPPPLSASEIIELLRGGVSSKRVNRLVSERGVSFALSNQTSQQIRSAGGDDPLLAAIDKAKK